MKFKLLIMSAMFSLGISGIADADDVNTHDGFYARLLAGPAWMKTTANFEETDVNADITGFGFGGFLMAGGTVADGLVIGGGIHGMHIVHPTIKLGNAEVEPDSDVIGMTFGPFVDYYPEPTGGLHFGALIGVSTLADADEDTEGVAFGIGASAFVGYDIWVGNQWSIGPMARFQYMHTVDRIGTGPFTTDVTFNTIVPVLMLSIAYH